MCPSAMSPELKNDLELKGQAPKRRAAAPDVRLSPLPARNTLLAVLFFSAVVAAILYWIAFPPAVPEPAENPQASKAQSAQRN